jgi:hypothetical protein
MRGLPPSVCGFIRIMGLDFSAAGTVTNRRNRAATDNRKEYAFGYLIPLLLINEVVMFLILSKPNCLSEQRVLMWFQLDLFRECSLVAIVKQRSESQRS